MFTVLDCGPRCLVSVVNCGLQHGKLWTTTCSRTVHVQTVVNHKCACIFVISQLSDATLPPPVGRPRTPTLTAVVIDLERPTMQQGILLSLSR